MFHFLPGIFFTAANGGHYIIPGSIPYDGYHNLHLPHNPPLYPTYSRVPHTKFSCKGLTHGYYADVDTGCQVNID